jgi:hypothetical protein
MVMIFDHIHGVIIGICLRVWTYICGSNLAGAYLHPNLFC